MIANNYISKFTKFIPAFALLIYSIILILTEAGSSQDQVRKYFTDISGPVFFYGVNTTISLFFLWSAGLMFLLVLIIKQIEIKSSLEKWFYVSQLIVFFYLGFDDRFTFHEQLRSLAGISGDYFLTAVTIAEGILLISFSILLKFHNQIKTKMYLALLFGAGMVFIDLAVPDELKLRLSVEDLCKTWSAFFFFLFSLSILQSKIRNLGEKEKSTLSGD